MQPEEVCGYRNYATFHVALFLSNTRPQYDHSKDLAHAAINISHENPLVSPSIAFVDPTDWLSEELKAYVEDQCLSMDAREGTCKTDDDILAHELLGVALGHVDWRQLAEEWLLTAKE